jgi:ubiquitin-protein ligase
MYKGGAFHFNFSVNQNFPHDPPKVKCTQKIYHPNIDLEGNVCLNILREDWKPVLNLNAVIVGMQVGLGHRRTRSVSFAGLTFGFAASSSSLSRMPPTL